MKDAVAALFEQALDQLIADNIINSIIIILGGVISGRKDILRSLIEFTKNWMID